MKRCPDCGYKGALDEEVAKHDLDGVAVVDGKNYRCPQCGAVHRSYVRIESLYREVACELASLDRRLRPDELRWLRKYLGYSGLDWAEYLGVQRETVSRWENGHQAVPLATERLLRMMAKAGPHIEEYGTPADFKEANVERPEFRQNSAGAWVRV